jgi:Helicase associated domain
MYQRLVKYKQEHGDCRVPRDWKGKKPYLGRWVGKQREMYRKRLLREDRLIQLEEIEFTWKLRNRVGRPNHERWYEWYDMLLAFREEHGHCNVPAPYEKDRSFSHWVVSQRKQQMHGLLLEDREQRLDEIGFTWSFEEQRFEQWREKYEKLRDVKRTNGKLGELSTDNKFILRSWVNRQRILFANGKLDMERKVLLDDIDFQWDMGSPI